MLAPSALPEGVGRGEPESHWHTGLGLLLNGIRLPLQVPKVLMEMDYSAMSARRLWCSPAQTLPVPMNHPAEMLAQLPPGRSSALLLLLLVMDHTSSRKDISYVKSRGRIFRFD